MSKLEEIREEIIEVACRNAYVESSRSEMDYDININKQGEDEIQEILERLMKEKP